MLHTYIRQPRRHAAVWALCLLAALLLLTLPAQAQAVITQDLPTSLTCVEGESVSFTCVSDGSYFYSWYKGGTLTASGTGLTTYSFTAAAGDDGASVCCAVSELAGGDPTNSTVCVLSVLAANNDPVPTITKNPTGETVTAGGSAMFIARADNASSYKWMFTSADGSANYESSQVRSQFSGLSISGESTTTLSISNIPAGFTGWKVYCIFSSSTGQIASSAAATVTVNKAVATPTASPKPTATPEPGHTHVFSDVWSSDDSFHWRECSCGVAADKAEHSFSWTVTREATATQDGERVGVCSVCGYRRTEAISSATVTPEPTALPQAQPQPSSGSRWYLYALIGLVVVGVAAVSIALARPRKAQKNYRTPNISFRCDKCGWTPKDKRHIPQYCPQCGDRFDEKDIRWRG